MWWVVLGCSEPSPPAPVEAAPPSVPVRERVRLALDEVVIHAEAGRTEAATAAWTEAHAGFEIGYEPVLRRIASPVEATRVEYQFALVHGEIGALRGGAVAERVAVLGLMLGAIPEVAPEPDPGAAVPPAGGAP